MADPPNHFFKFIPPGFLFNLSIPSYFLTCSKLILRRGRHEWSIDINDGVFSDGWRRFVKENGVQEFDFIVFKHYGSMVFEFSVFDQSTCERQYPTLLDEMDVEEPPKDSDTIRTHKGQKIFKKRKMKEFASQDHKKFQVKKETGSSMKKKSSLTPCNYQYFILNLTPSNFTKSALNLPIHFSAQNALNSGAMILRDDKGRSWALQMTKREEKYLYLGPIKPFLVANGFKEGDEYKFELVDKEKDKPPIAKLSSINGSISSEEDGRHYCMGELKSYNIQQSDLVKHL